MNLLHRLVKSKRAEQLTIEDMPFWIIIILVILILAGMIYAGIKLSYDEKLTTHDIEHTMWKERIISSLSYIDYGRSHVRIIDPDLVTDEILNTIFVQPYADRMKKMVFKVTLSYEDKQKTIYSDKELYEDAEPLIRLKYDPSISKDYVLVKDNNKFKRGTLHITELTPR